MGLNKTVPDPWVRNGMAGADWMTAFLKRNSTISLRFPEATSLSRATSFNKVNVANFFNKLESVYAREQFTPDRIWNIDETGCTAVQKPTKIVAATGIKQVGTIVSAERGQLVTVCCAVSATGNSVPPMFVFPRVNYRDHFLNGAPTRSTGTTHPSGWMTSEGFLTHMKHFAAHVRPSRDDKALVLLDNHESHLSIDVLQYAKDNGVVMLSFPPHCPHKLQPLDRTVYGPLKRYYNAACDGWIVSNKGRIMSIYDIPAMVEIAFSRAMTPGNILSGFKISGVFPFDRHIFPDREFLPSDVTDRPDPGIADAAVPAINEVLPTGDYPSVVDALPSGDEHVTSGAIVSILFCCAFELGPPRI